MRLISFIIVLLHVVTMTADAQSPVLPDLRVGIVYGRVTHAGGSKAMEGATIEILELRKDSASGSKKEFLIVTESTNKRGDFYIERLPVTNILNMHVSAVGYSTFELRIDFAVNAQAANATDINKILPQVNRDLGTITLQTTDKELDNITVVSEKPLIEMYLDKRAYNIDKNLQAPGGTVLDIMRNVPGISVDISGGIQLRNGTPQIFVDGRPSTLSPDQIPADQVASIELITNPSSRFDASSDGGGIVNIVLKKNKLAGYNGSLRTNIDSHGKPGFGGDFNVRRKKMNVFAGVSYNSRKNVSTAAAERWNYSGPDTIHIYQKNNPVLMGYLAFARAGADYFVNNRTTFSLTGSYFKAKFTSDDQLKSTQDSISNIASASQSSIRDIHADIVMENKGLVLAMKHIFAKPGNELTTDLSYYNSTLANTSDYLSRFFNVSGTEKPAAPAERAVGGSNTDYFTAQLDYTSKSSNNLLFETGIRFTQRSYDSWNDNFRYNSTLGRFNIVSALTVQYLFEDHVMAGYAQVEKNYKKWSVQAGIRAESSLYNGNLKAQPISYNNKYPLSLFPSAFVSRKIDEKQDIQWNYSRKVSRPTVMQLLPFLDYSDSLNLTLGNPSLRPEFSHLTELNYLAHYKKGQDFFVTIYARYAKDVIARYQYKAPNTNPSLTDSLIYNTYANAGNGTTMGTEFIFRNKIKSWWDLTCNLNLFYVNLQAGNLPDTRNIDRFSWFSKLNSNFYLPANFGIQLSADYQAKTLLPVNTGRTSTANSYTISGQTLNVSQGYIDPVYGIDAAIKKDLLKNKAASITLQVIDIFKMRKYETYSNSSYFSQHNSRQRDSQVFRLNLNWHFGKVDVALFKRKNSKADNEVLPGLQVGTR